MNRVLTQARRQKETQPSAMDKARNATMEARVVAHRAETACLPQATIVSQLSFFFFKKVLAFHQKIDHVHNFLTKSSRSTDPEESNPFTRISLT